MAGGFPTYPDPEYLQYLEQAQEMGEDQVAILVDDDDDDDDEDYEEEDGDEEDYNDGEEDGPVPQPPRVSSESRSTPSQEAVIARFSTMWLKRTKLVGRRRKGSRRRRRRVEESGLGAKSMACFALFVWMLGPMAVTIKSGAI
ncbi:protein SIS2-like [Actinidia eriantha]|uniref:protein SIS2-like n=1 Tax=Actinidia eriantha TaxID=165200 RepID=UPI0025899E07|nr:protein SIS2-like [Actinidia eriantha]